jgi:acyl-coenzyme A thioesterase PaaI-like protein
VSAALFTREGANTWKPTDRARGPWSPDALHGGAVAALLAHAAIPHVDDLQTVRLTVELTRTVPVDALTVTAEVVRPGRRVRAVAATMSAGGREVATASLVAIRTADVPAPAQPSVAPPPGPEHGRAPNFTSGGTYEALHNSGVEHRFVIGSFEDPGPATDWIRLRVPLIEGETPSPLERVAVAADFGNGVSRIIDFEQLLFINPDLTIYLHRLPVGEWVCLDSVTRIEPYGIGLATSDLYDGEGPIGRSLQSLVVDAL